jgi:hypothetical protein
MPKTSVIYSSIFNYRLMMQLLYKGHYYKRFERIQPLIKGNTVTELCFADTVIATYCKKNNIRWTGIDLQAAFVNNALKKGFNAQLQDIQSLTTFEKADTLIVAGSLYHFQNDLENLFKKMLAAAPRIIISEPIINLSNRNGIIGKLAKASANVKGKKQAFRFTELTLKNALTVWSKQLNFKYEVVEQFNKDLIIVIQK